MLIQSAIHVPPTRFYTVIEYVQSNRGGSATNNAAYLGRASGDADKWHVIRVWETDIKKDLKSVALLNEEVVHSRLRETRS